MSIRFDQLRGDIPLSKLDTDPLDRANHTGTQLAETVSDFNTAADARITAAGIDTKTLDMKDMCRIRMSMNESTFDADTFSTTQQSLTIEEGDRIFIQVTDAAEKSGVYLANLNGTAATVGSAAVGS